MSYDLDSDMADLEHGFNSPDLNPWTSPQPPSSIYEAFNNDDEPNQQSVPEASHWKCVGCDSGFSSWVNGRWECDNCGVTDFYDSRKPTRMQTSSGVWMFMPHAGDNEPEGNVSPLASSARSRRRRRKKFQTGGPDSPPGSAGNGDEQAESETMTIDPAVEPSEPRVPQPPPAASGRVSQRGFQQHRSQSGASARSQEDQLLAALRKLVQQKTQDDEDWNVKKGPEKGVRWKSGQHPLPPQWKYDQQDLRAFAKFEKKVKIWQIQMGPYATAADQALLLWGSLTGDAEQELEHLTIDEVHCDFGIETILRKLQVPFEQRAVFQKRKFLHEFESLRRYNGEVMRVYIQRFRRSIRNLQSVGIDITMSYDTEALGSRLLDRSGLSQDAQRMILVGTQQRLHLETIAEALVLQFPDFRGAPPIQGLQSKGGGKGKPTSSTSSTLSSSSTLRSSGKGSSYPASRVMVVENPETTLEQVPEEDDEQQQDDQPDDDPDDPAEDGDDGEDEDDLDLEGLSQVLTVTAKKLAGITLGRKFSTQKPRSSKDDANIAKKKLSSHCMACGQKGHWKGDAICPMTLPSKSTSYASDSKGNSKGDRPGFRKQQPSQQQKSQAFTVVHHEHGCMEVVDDQDYGNMFQCNMVHCPQEFQVHEVHAFSVKSFVGKLIIDSGCQRNCCGPDWYDQHIQLLRQHDLHPTTIPCDDLFQFGKGEPLQARFRSYMPAGVGYMRSFLVGAAVVDAQVPLLGSHSLFEELQAIIDLPEKKIHLKRLNMSLPLVLVSGHLTICIDEFPMDACDQMKQFDHEHVWHDPNPNGIFSTLQESSAQSDSLRDLPQFDRSAHVLAASRMAEEVASSGAAAAQLRDGDLHLHGKGSKLGHHASSLASDGGSASHGHASGSTSVPPSRVQAVRECQREIRSVPSMRPQMEMGQCNGQLARFPWIAKLLYAVAAIATTVLDPHSSQVQAEGTSQSQVFGEQSFGYGGTAADFRGINTASSSASNDRGAEFGCSGFGTNYEPGGPMADPARNRAEHGLLPPGARHGPSKIGATGTSGPTTSQSKPDLHRAPGGRGAVRMGRLRRLQHSLRQCINNYEAEGNVYQALPTVSDRPPPLIDVFEIFSGSSKFTLRASSFGLNALQPLDLAHGPQQDLKDPRVRSEVIKAAKKFKPWFIIMGLDCRFWNLFNINLNYSQRLDLLKELQEDELPLVELACELAIFQHKHGRYFLIENPQRSRLWELQPILDVESMPLVWKTTLDTGAFGAEVHGHRVAKPMTFLGNIPELDEVITRRLSQEERQACTPIEGKLTRPSQEYPDQLVQTILKHMKKIVQLREPQRFAHQQVFAVTQPTMDLSAWKDILDHVNQTFERSSKRPFYIDIGSELGQKIGNLARMDLTRIQCAHTPTTRRLPQATVFGDGVTHRAALLQYNDGQRALEFEALLDLQLPKQRFDRPVKLAIFMFGKMRDEPDPRPTADDDNYHLPIPNMPTDITFPNLPTGHGISLDTRKTVARLHINLGHPSPQELTRMVAYYGGAPSSITTCIQHLRCSTCDRLKDAQQPRPATMPKFVAGQFGDEVQGDIFYLRLLSTEAIPILGLVDKATGFHQAAVCQTRNSAETFKVIMQCWLRPYGLPFKLFLDPDTAFRGDFQAQVEHLGIICDFCPAEAHWMIGMVERRNSILRCVLEKLVDQFAVYDIEMLEHIIPPALHAVNSSTFTRGRTAYQAVFGRIPRLPGGILTDDTGITTSAPTIDSSDNLLAKAEIIRSEAQKHLIDLNCSQQLRRALLRKTRNTTFPELLPGQNCAYWRWQRRGQKKRGGWVIAKFLGWDPASPMKLAWVQSGTSTTLVSVEQLRTALGFEQWNPDPSDIKALKSGIKSFQDHLLQDEVGPPAPDQPIDDADIINPDTTEQQVTMTALPPPTPALPALPATPTLPPPQQATNTMTQEQNIQMRLQQSPTYQQTNIYQRFGAPPTPQQLTPLRPPQATTQPTTPQPRLQGRTRSPLPRTRQLTNTAEADNSNQRQRVSQPEAGAQPPEQQAGEDMPPGTTQQPTAEAPFLHQAPQTPVELSQQQSGDTTPELPPTQQSPTTSTAQQPTPMPQSGVTSTTHQPTHLPQEPLPVQQDSILVIDLTTPDQQQVSPGILPVQQQGTLPETTAQSDPYMNVDPVLPQKRPFDTMTTLYLDAGNIQHATPWTDGAPSISYGPQQQAYFKAYTTTSQRHTDTQAIGKDLNESDTTAYSSDTDNDTPPNKQTSCSTTNQASHSSPTNSNPAQRLTRQEAKQLDRELPWREIWAMPKAHIQKFLAAIEKEANSWNEWESIRPLSNEEIQKIKADPKLRRRILRSRAAYRDKNRGQGELRAKCRIVALGHCDPDLGKITRSSPTPGRTTEHVMYALAVAGMNRELGRTSSKWKCWLGDAATAFLQGRQPDDERGLPLYMARPKDPLIDMTPFWKTELYQVLGNIYGLPNAPHLWCQEVINRLLGINYKQHDFDKMMFCKYDANGDLQSAVMCYVDDFFGIHRSDYEIQELHDLFKWGELRYFQPGVPQTFKGKELCFAESKAGRFTLNITLSKFLETVDPYVLPKGRMQKPEKLTESEQREFRSIAGCLQWLGSQARPDLCPAISLSNHGQNTTIYDLKTLAETLQYAKDTSEYGFIVQDVPVNENSVILTYTDASWGNAGHSASQMGILVTLTTPDVLEKPSKVMLMDWRSSRSPRVCRSTLAAEASAADEGSDRAAFVNMMLSEVIHNEMAHKIGCKLDYLQATDSKSLYDAIVAANPNLTDKRSLVNVRAIQEVITPQQTRWVPTHLMHADGLTKLNAALRLQLLQWLQNPLAQLTDGTVKADGSKKKVPVKNLSS